MITRTLKLAVLFLGLCFLFGSCCNGDRKISKRLLSEAAQVLEQKPEVALGILHRVDINLLNEKDYAHYLLLQVRALDRTGASTASFEEEVSKARDVLIAAGDAPKVAYACFVLANVADAQGKPSVMLYHDLQADKWAERAGYSIPDFPYPFIPYNIAICYFDEGQFSDALQFVNKSLVYININKEGSKYADHKRQVLEMKGLCLRNLNAIDSAFYYYAKAMELAEAARDTAGINRIQYNRMVLLSADENIERSEERCRSLIASFSKSDSLNLGFMHMALSKIQLDSEQFDLAYASVYAAKNYFAVLANRTVINSYYIKHVLYKRLEKAERAMNNTTLADSYRRQRDSLAADWEESRKAQYEEVQTLTRAQAGDKAHVVLQVKDTQRHKYQKQHSQISLLLYLLLALAAGFALYHYRQQYTRKKVMRRLIVQEAVVGISSSSYLNRIASKAEHVRVMGEDNEALRIKAMEIAGMADDLKQLVRQMPVLTYSYSKLYRRIRKDYPQLTETERYIFVFLNTRTLTDKEIMGFLELTPERYASLKQSMYDKMAGKL